MLLRATEEQDDYDAAKDHDLHKHTISDAKQEAQHAIFSKG
jgi:hypothetical protein